MLLFGYQKVNDMKRMISTGGNNTLFYKKKRQLSTVFFEQKLLIKEICGLSTKIVLFGYYFPANRQL